MWSLCRHAVPRLSSLSRPVSSSTSSRLVSSSSSTMSRVVETSIRTKLSSELRPQHLEVFNESHLHAVPPGSESHFRVLVVSESFRGLSLLQRHRLVNEVLQEELRSRVHALSVQAKTPEQWQEDPRLEKSPGCMGGSRGDRSVEEKLRQREEN